MSHGISDRTDDATGRRGTRSRLRLRDLQVKRLMRPSRVVVVDEVAEHVPEQLLAGAL
ncbi:MAG: hypothetical protein DK306_001885 [Chloroflexi bacterium]|jgi:hypothetical protein|nr:MAG: hypothetical protein DK306_001885 [Chloroflexota bacterium]